MSYATPGFINVPMLRMPSSGHLPSYWRKIYKKNPQINNGREELDGYRLERSAAGDQEPPAMTY
jgi:hypothetical protein